ncbi:MAG: glycosyltransferase [candidate division WOR-3 bacterium]
MNKKYPYQMIGKEKLLRNRITGDYLGILFGKIIEKLVCKNADAIITCYFLDLKRKSEFKDKLFFFVPWPTYVPHRYNERKCEHRAIYIGALDSHKNIKEFEKILPEIFAKTPIKEFIFVGTGRDLHLIMELKKKYPDRIILINFLPREECLRLIASSFVAISPAIIGGWGFIGDAWATGTPIIVTHNHYNFKNKMDAIVTSPDNIADSINELYQNPQLYESIINAGYHRFRTHHDAQLIGAKYYEICKLTINKFQRSHERMS